MSNSILFIFLISYLITIIYCFPVFDYSHNKGENLYILAGSVSSKRAIIPFAYTKLNICHSHKIIQQEDTLGEILTGDSYYTTGYFAHTNRNKFCEILCYNNFTENKVKFLKRLIERKYFINWVVDKLPAGKINFDKETKRASLDYFSGIPLGFKVNDTYYIYNHLEFHISLNKLKNQKYNVVGFNILPMSIKHNENQAICEGRSIDLIKNFDKPLQPLEPGNILFTYDVIFEFSEKTFASRWDNYKPSKTAIHWTGIFTSILIISFTTILVLYVLKQNVNNDIDTYNFKVSQMEEIDDYDWKQIPGDVFRPPMVNTLLLASILGTGTQLLSMFTITLLLGVLGFMRPERRTNILNIGILLYCLCGLIAGYVSSYFYRFFGGESWLKVAVLTSSLFPGTLLFGYSIINIILIIENSNASANFSDILSLFMLWLFCTFPLVLIGSFFGYKNNKMIFPFTVNKISSIIPSKPWYLRYRYITFLTGLFGFATIFIEFNYVMAAIWKHHIYFLAAFLWVSFTLFIIVVGEMTILVVYFNLCYGDYNWWWKSFIVGSSPVIYFVAYSIYYFFYLRITRLSAMVIYFGMMGLISAMVIFICGTVSVFFSMGFLNKIYSKIRIY